MAALGNIGVLISEVTLFVNAGTLRDLSGNITTFDASQRRLWGGVAAHGGVSVADRQSVRDVSSNPIARPTSRGRQVSGETQLDGTPEPLLFAVTSAGVIVRKGRSDPALILRDLNENMEYEITVFGEGSQRTETWGPTSIAAQEDLTISGDLDPCTASVAYSSGLTRSGGFGVATWDLWPSLPSGLGFDTATGVISGTTTAVGSYSIDIGVTVEGHRRWKNVTLTVT